MKVVTWNMGYWLHRERHPEAWTYLREILRPDLALLQETMRPRVQDGEAIHFHDFHQGWGTAIYSKTFNLDPIKYEGRYPGRVVMAIATIPSAATLFLASIHAPIIENQVFPHLSNIIDEVEQIWGPE